MGKSNFVILGMHRSGTSLISGLLEKSGVFFGEGDELTGANIENPKGFFERRDFRDVNDELLLSNNGDWDIISPIIEKGFNFETVNNYQNKLKLIFREKLDGKQWGIKEPRFCITYSLMEPMIPEHKILFVFRDPLDVANSLYKRNRFPIPFGLLLWEEYNRMCLNILENTNRPFEIISYDAILDNSKEEIERLRTFMEADVVDLSFIDAGLNRSSKHKVDLHRFLTESQKELFAVLNKKQVKSVNRPSENNFNLEQFEAFIVHVSNSKEEINRQLVNQINKKEKLENDLLRVNEDFKSLLTSLRYRLGDFLFKVFNKIRGKRAENLFVQRIEDRLNKRFG